MHFTYYLKGGRPALPLALAAIGLLSCPRIPVAAAAEKLPPQIAASTMWDDGNAEFSQYEGTTERYGETRPTRARIVIVKEDMLLDSRVKSERGPLGGRTTEVLKVVFVAEFTTGSYFYRQAATTFLDRRSFEVMKESMSHFDGCGITYIRVGPKQGRMVHEAHSYWEGEADRETPLIWPLGRSARVFWDGLPLWLRGQVATGGTSSVSLLPSQVSGHSPAEAARPKPATIQWSEAGTIEVPAGAFEARLAEVSTHRGIDRFWFDAKFPHVLLRMETTSGRKLALRKSQRIDYWNHHAVGDERLVE